MSGRNLPKSDTNPNGEGYGAQSQVGIGAGRKFVLRVFNQQNIVDHGKAVDLWLKLQAAISKIQRGESSSLKFEELYRFVLFARDWFAFHAAVTQPMLLKN